MQSPYILPSNAPALKSLQVSSEYLGSEDSDDTTTKLFSHASHQRVGDGSRVTKTNKRLGERKRRRQTKPLDKDGNPIPWEKIRDPVLTKSELQSPRYLLYRAKQRNPKRSKNGQVWTDELEEAFQLALRAIPLLGRKKKQYPSYGEKQWGRNELISNFIFERTGIERNRKKVSSHIQVLKGFLVENGDWMALVTQPNQNQTQNGYGNNNIGRRSSSHLIKSESHECSDVRPSPYFNTVQPPPYGVPGSSLISQGYHVRRVNFEMSILDQDLERLHIYSSLQSEIGSASRRLENIPNWQLIYPQLATYYDQGQLDGEIILFETNFDLMGRHPPPKSNLRIDFTIDIARGIDFVKWECHSEFYERGIMQKRLSTLMDSEYIGPSDDARIVVLLHSKWWVDNFTDMTKQKQEIEEGDVGAMQQVEEKIRRQIRDISVVQEIWATHKAGGSTSERMAILIWSFRQTRNHEVATTTWRKLIPPAKKAEPYTPTLDLAVLEPQSSFALDTTLQHHGLQRQSPLYAQYFKPEPFFAENSETLFAETGTRLSPSSSTPIHDYHSLPSSTSVSFPSSISSSTLPPELTQESSFVSHEPIFHSQELEYPGHELGFDSQDAVSISKEVSYSSEDLRARSSEDVAYLSQHTAITNSQESTYASQDYYYVSQARTDSLYCAPPHSNYPSNPRDPYTIIDHKEVDAENSIQEFNGMHSQLSFAEPESPPLYDAPYNAPSISMMASEQLDYNELQHQPPCLELHGQKTSNLSHQSHQLHHDCFEIGQWEVLDHNVQWATNKSFQTNGDLEEVCDVMKQHGHGLGEIGELEKGINADLAFL